MPKLRQRRTSPSSPLQSTSGNIKTLVVTQPAGDLVNDGLGACHSRRGSTSRRRNAMWCHVAALIIGSLMMAAGATTCRVSPAGSGNGSGADWSNTASLSSVLDGMTPALAACSELWLLQGTYLPNGGTRSATFLIDRPLQLYGGFAGIEPTRDGRTLNSSLTILSGDIGIAGSAADNAYHVLTLHGASNQLLASNTVIDNLTIADGNADGNSFDESDRGGGVNCRYNCSATFNNVTFRNNAARRGGAMFHSSVSAAYTSRPVVRNSTFHDNRADYGAAFLSHADGAGLTASATFSNTTFASNTAAQSGGALFVQGAYGGNASPDLTHVTLSGNSAAAGGGAIAVYGVAGTASVVVRNSILTGNTGSSAADASLVRDGGSASFDTTNVQGGCPAAAACSNVIDLVMALGPLDWNGGATRTMLPGANSGALNRAADGFCAATDQRGIARPQGSKCDLGAVERRLFVLNVSVVGNGTVSSTGLGGIALCSAAGGTCSSSHDGDTVPNIAFDLVAAPAAGHYPQWGGACVSAGTSMNAGITMNASHSCTVTFFPTAIGFSAFVSGVTPPNAVNLELQSPAIAGGENIYSQIGGLLNFSSRLSYGTAYSLVVTTSPGLNCRVLGNPPASGTAPRHDLAFKVDCNNPPAWPACSLDVNGNGLFDQADARAIAAWLSGMRGNALYAAAQPSNGRDAAALDAFISAQVNAGHYDLDADGATQPLADGLMLLRLALGVRGPAVLNRALGNDAMRNSWSAIADYLTNHCGMPLSP